MTETPEAIARAALERGLSVRESATLAGLSSSKVAVLRREIAATRAALGQPPLPSAKPGPRSGSDSLVVPASREQLAELDRRAGIEGVTREQYAARILWGEDRAKV